MSKRSLLVVAAACAFAALAASGLAGGRAKADGVRRPLAFQQGRADAYACPSPSPGAGTSGKIASSGSSDFYSNVTCSSTLAVLYHGRKYGEPTVTPLRLVSGAAALRALAVDSNGQTVGVMISPKGVEVPYKWNTDGEASRIESPNQGIATAIGLGGSPITGDVLDSKGYFQAYRFSPSPTFIAPAGYTKVNAVNGYSPPTVAELPTYVGEVAGRVAVAVPPNVPFQPIDIGIPDNYPSTALAISDYDYIVGQFFYPKGTCGETVPARGFGFQYPKGPSAMVLDPLNGDCISAALAVDDAKGIVGYSSAGTGSTQRAEGYNLPNFPTAYVDLNASSKLFGARTWASEGHRLVSATGIDANGDITATDSAGVIWFLYFPSPSQSDERN
jgi:hypothetical protein